VKLPPAITGPHLKELHRRNRATIGVVDRAE
jgi:hypothetical protein